MIKFKYFVDGVSWSIREKINKFKCWLSYGLVVKLNEDAEFAEEVANTNGIHIYLYPYPPDDYKYFVLYKEEPNFRLLRPYMTRVCMTNTTEVPEYVTCKNLFSKRWILTNDEKNRLCELLSSKYERGIYAEKTVWEVLYIRSEQYRLGMAWDETPDVEIPSMPNYMELPNKI